jgi:hypothetical protein
VAKLDWILGRIEMGRVPYLSGFIGERLLGIQIERGWALDSGVLNCQKLVIKR